MKNKGIDFIFLGIIILIILPGTLKPIIKPYEVNYYENRPSIKFITPNKENIFDNTFQDNVEKTFGDQIPFVTYMKKANNLLEAFLSLNLNKNLYKKYNSEYIPFNSLYLYNNKIVYNYINVNEVKDILDKKISNINEYINNNEKLDFYFYYIESDYDINMEENLKTGVYEYLEKNIKTTNISKFSIDNFEEYNQYYYDTDHHWNYKGFYKGYKEIVGMMGIDEVLMPIEEVCINQKFNGSKAYTTRVADIKYDQLCAYMFEYKPHKIYLDGKEVNNYGEKDGFINGDLDNIAYGLFYGDDYEVVEFDFLNDNKENILVIGNSFDNAIAEMIASHFNKSYFVDLRDYENFNFSSFVEEHDIEIILINGPYSLLEDDKIILKG